MSANPVLVEVTRGDMVESRHRGAVAVVRADGELIASLGDISRLIYPRSAIKPIQALFLIESGAADALGLSDKELALACASHNGEPEHVDTVRAWLARMGLDGNALECGAHPPRRGKDRKALIEQGLDPSPMHNNCSGKHAGFLSSAYHLRLPVEGYIKRSHPVQRAVLDILAQLSGANLDHEPEGLDGCGIPVVGIGLRPLARAFAAFVSREALGSRRADAAGRIFDAMVSQPFMVAGSGRWCTRAMQAGQGAFIVKTGAEGVFCAAVPQAQIGIALKIDDGAARAAEHAMGAVLSCVPHLAQYFQNENRELISSAIHNVAGKEVGEIRPAPDIREQLRVALSG